MTQGTPTPDVTNKVELGPEGIATCDIGQHPTPSGNDNRADPKHTHAPNPVQTAQPPSLATPVPGVNSPACALFIKAAELRPFSNIGLSGGEKPDTYNNDLFLSSFRPSKYTWEGEQRKGATCHIQNSTSIPGHVRKAVDMEFFTSKEVPMTDEIRNSIAFIAKIDRQNAEDFWTSQLGKIRKIVNDAEPTQRVWEMRRPKELSGTPSPLRTVALAHLMGNFDIGGGKWLRQFIHGFDIIGTFEQKGGFPARRTTPGPTLR